jgi:hypothetical protein
MGKGALKQHVSIVSIGPFSNTRLKPLDGDVRGGS